jgi:hypothetical protein
MNKLLQVGYVKLIVQFLCCSTFYTLKKNTRNSNFEPGIIFIHFVEVTC